MKNLQKFICLLALFVGINSLSAQDDELEFASHGLLGLDYFKIVFTNGTKNSVCDASFFLKSSLALEDEYLPMKLKSCDVGANGERTLKLAAPDGKLHKVNYSPKNGLILSRNDDDTQQETGASYIFGDYTLLQAGKNEVHVISAGENTYLIITVPKFELKNEVFNFRNKTLALAFSKTLDNFFLNTVEEFDFSALLASSLENVAINAKVTMNKKRDFILELNYNGKSISQIIDKMK